MKTVELNDCDRILFILSQEENSKNDANRKGTLRNLIKVRKI